MRFLRSKCLTRFTTTQRVSSRSMIVHSRSEVYLSRLRESLSLSLTGGIDLPLTVKITSLLRMKKLSTGRCCRDSWSIWTAKARISKGVISLTLKLSVCMEVWHVHFQSLVDWFLQFWVSPLAELKMPRLRVDFSKEYMNYANRLANTLPHSTLTTSASLKLMTL